MGSVLLVLVLATSARARLALKQLQRLRAGLGGPGTGSAQARIAPTYSRIGRGSISLLHYVLCCGSSCVLPWRYCSSGLCCSNAVLYLAIYRMGV